MKKLSFLFLCFFLIIFSCKDDNIKDNSDNNLQNFTGINKKFVFDAEQKQKKWNANIVYYETENNSLVITALNNNNERLFVVAESGQTGENKLDSRSFFSNNDETFFVESGELNITSIENDFLNGTFNFEARSISDTNKTTNFNVKFEKITALNYSDNITINTNKIMLVNTEKGKVEYKNSVFDIELKQSIVVFKNIDDGKKSFSLKTKKPVKNGTSYIYKSTNPDIDKIFVDLIKSQVSVFYKNNKIKTFY